MYKMDTIGIDDIMGYLRVRLKSSPGQTLTYVDSGIFIRLLNHEPFRETGMYNALDLNSYENDAYCHTLKLDRNLAGRLNLAEGELVTYTKDPLFDSDDFLSGDETE